MVYARERERREGGGERIQHSLSMRLDESRCVEWRSGEVRVGKEGRERGREGGQGRG